MFRVIDGETADELWLKAAAWFGSDGSSNQQSSRCGDTSEVLHAAMSLRDPRQRWISSRSPAMNPAFALAEVIWIMSGRNDAAFLNYFNPTLPNFAGTGPIYHGAYGFRLRKHFGIDQMERAYRALQGNPHSRQIAMQIWSCVDDLPGEAGCPSAPDIPCNVMSLIKVREGRLEWTQIMRSNDLFLGMPHNIVQFTSLQEIIAGWLGVDVGGYHHFADSLHVYGNSLPVEGRITTPLLSRNYESIALPKAESDRSFEVLSWLGDVLGSPETSVEAALGAFQASDLPQAYRNWASILTADALRRRGAHKEMELVVGECSNTCLAELFKRWLSRKAPLGR